MSNFCLYSQVDENQSVGQLFCTNAHSLSPSTSPISQFSSEHSGQEAQWNLHSQGRQGNTVMDAPHTNVFPELLYNNYESSYYSSQGSNDFDNIYTPQLQQQQQQIQYSSQFYVTTNTEFYPPISSGYCPPMSAGFCPPTTMPYSVMENMYAYNSNIVDNSQYNNYNQQLQNYMHGQQQYANPEIMEDKQLLNSLHGQQQYENVTENVKCMNLEIKEDQVLEILKQNKYSMKLVDLMVALGAEPTSPYGVGELNQLITECKSLVIKGGEVFTVLDKDTAKDIITKNFQNFKSFKEVNKTANIKQIHVQNVQLDSFNTCVNVPLHKISIEE